MHQESQDQASRPMKSFSAFKRHFLPPNARQPGSSGLEGAEDIEAREPQADAGPSAFGHSPDWLPEELGEQALRMLLELIWVLGSCPVVTCSPRHVKVSILCS